MSSRAEIIDDLFLVVGGEVRRCPRVLWDGLLGPFPPLDWTGGNGCSGPAPERYRGWYLWPACQIHDWHYCGEIDMPRVVADLIFRINLARLVQMQGGSEVEAAQVAASFYAAVTACGGPHYTPWKHAPTR